jgi:hypothetical protein
MKICKMYSVHLKGKLGRRNYKLREIKTAMNSFRTARKAQYIRMQLLTVSTYINWREVRRISLTLTESEFKDFLTEAIADN